MTVPSKVYRESYTGTGTSSGPFTFQWRILTDNMIRVYERDTDGDQRTLTLDSDYKITGVGDADGGHITLYDGDGSTLRNLPTDYELVILPFAEIKQTYDFSNQGDYSAEDWENAVDYVTITQKMIQETLDRTVKLSETSDDVITDLDVENIGIVAGVASDVTTVAGISSDVETVADNIVDIQNAEANATAAAASAASASDDADRAETAAANLPQNKLDATSAPTVNDDSDDGYSIGSRWFDVTNDEAYLLLDSTVGAAVWVNVTLETGELGGLAVLNEVNGNTINIASSTSGTPVATDEFLFNDADDSDNVKRAQLQDIVDFVTVIASDSLSSTGHVEFPNGFKVNWGTDTLSNDTSGTTDTLTLDSAFDNAIVWANVEIIKPSGGGRIWAQIQDLALDEIDFEVNNPGNSASASDYIWLAIGY